MELQLLNEIETIRKSFQRVADANGENFNLFSILRLESNEVSTHSRFIAALLDPNGKHGLKQIPLRLFLESINSRFAADPPQFEVSVEYYIGPISEDKTTGGRIDILLKSNNGQVLMIENKVYAYEQENQLLRYRKAYPKGELFYLTLFDEQSYQHDLLESYRRISYKKHIVHWLELCRKEAAAIPVLRETIVQYLHLIKKLTNQNTNHQMNQEIAKRVLQDKSSLKSFLSLVESRDAIKQEVIHQKLKLPLIKFCKENGLDYIWERGFPEILTKWGGFRLKSNSLSENNVMIAFEFDQPNESVWSFGFAYVDKNIGLNEKIKLLFDEVFNEGRPANSTIDWPRFLPFKPYDISWNSPEVLIDMQFGSFEKEFIQKLNNLLKIGTTKEL
jgi:hypothetical protein